MAAKYRKIDPRIWDDEVFDGLDADDALAALWILTGRSVNRAGVVVVGLGEAADKLRLQGVDQAWDTLSKVCFSFDWPFERIGRNTVVIVLRSWFRYNSPTNADHLAGMLSDLTDVPRCDLMKQYKPAVKQHLDPKWHQAFDTLSLEPSTPCGTQAPTPCAHQKQKQKQDSLTGAEAETEGGARGDSGESPDPSDSNGSAEKPKPKTSPYTKAFERFWEAYPKIRRKAKGTAFGAWKIALGRVVGEDDPAGYLIGRAVDYAASEEGKSRFAKGPTPWLRGRCWEDDPESWKRGDDDAGTKTASPGPGTDFDPSHDYGTEFG